MPSIIWNAADVLYLYHNTYNDVEEYETKRRGCLTAETVIHRGPRGDDVPDVNHGADGSNTAKI